jgi:TP901 family phage tail tape measure protein
MAQSKTNIWIDGSQAGSTLKELKKSVNLLNREINQLPRSSDEYKKKVLELKDANTALNSHKNQIKGVSQSYGAARQGIGGMISQFAPMIGAVGIATTVVGGLTSAVGSWYRNNKEMEKSLSSLKALTGASAEDVKFYKEEAQEMGRATTVSAMETVEAFKLIGSARPELLKNKEALAAITKETITFSEAAEMDMATSAQAVAGAMNQFNLAADQGSRIINAYAAGSKEGAAEVDDLSQSIDKFGTVANQNNVTLEESVALTELLSEKNIKGSEAGTQLRNVLLSISTASALPAEAQAAMKQYGVDMEIVQNKALPLEERLREMAKVQGDQNALVKIFGKENIVAGATVLKNVDHLADLTQAVTGTNTAYEQAAINTDNLDGDLKSLGSAWEGLTLSMDGGGAIFRPLVQAGTDMLNWTTDTITAFQEWDTTAMETSLLKLGRAILPLPGYMEDMWDEQIKINEISQQVIDTVKEEADSVVVLTGSLSSVNEKLKEKNLTDEETNQLQQEQAEYVNELKTRYPELTKELDLQTASSERLSRLQKEINANLVEQAVQSAMAAEQERILGEIIKKTIDVNSLRAKEQKRGFFENVTVDAFSESSREGQVEIRKLYDELGRIPEVSKEVMKATKDMQFAFGADFQIQTDMVEKSTKKIEWIEKRLGQGNLDKAAKEKLEVALKAEKATVDVGEKKIKQMQDAAKWEANKQKTEENAAAAEENRLKVEENAEKVREQNAEKAKQRYKELRDELDKLLESTEKFTNDNKYQKDLDAFTEAKEKELFVLQHTLDEKYDKEIQEAERLSKVKGEIGVKGQDALNTLLALKEEELSREKLKINDKYTKEKQEQEYEAQKTANLAYLEQQTSLEDARVEIKVSRAAAAVKAVGENDLAGFKAANEEYNQALEAQLEHEKTRKKEALLDQLGDDKINREEYKLRLQELEYEHQEKINEIQEQAEEERQQQMLDHITGVVETISQVFDAVAQLREAEFKMRFNDVENVKNKEIAAVEEQYKKGIISKEEYETKKGEIERKAEEEKKVIEAQKAKSDKQMALFEGGIAAALAILKAAPNPLMMALAAATGIAQMAVIATTPVPQFADGGYHNVVGAKDGKMYNAKYIGRHSGGMLPDSPSLVLASEKGREYFVPNHLLQDQRVVNSVRVIEAIRTNQFADGGFTAGAVAAGGVGDDQLIAFLQANINMMSALGAKIDNIAVYIGDKQIDAIDTRAQELKALRS